MSDDELNNFGKEQGFSSPSRVPGASEGKSWRAIKIASNEKRFDRKFAWPAFVAIFLVCAAIVGRIIYQGYLLTR